MKPEEKIAKDYFEYNGFSNLEYEPNGNIPPDFVINGEIAIEVRRLNKHFQTGNKSIPLEELQFKLIPKIKDLLKSYGDSNHTESSLVSVYYQRPLKTDKILLNKIREVLSLHSKELNSTKYYEITENLNIRIAPSSIKLEQQFVYFSSIDCNEGGFVLSTISDNLEHLLREKEQKIIPYFNLYKKWWIVFVDYIGYGLSMEEIENLEIKWKSNYFERIYFIGKNVEQGGYK